MLIGSPTDVPLRPYLRPNYPISDHAWVWKPQGHFASTSAFLREKIELMETGSLDTTFANRKARLKETVKEIQDNPKSTSFQELLNDAWARPEVVAEKDLEKKRILANAYAGFHELPPNGVCINMMQTVDTYCRRKLLPGSADCFWHAIRNEKADAALVASYFENGLTIGQAMELEVRAGRSLANTYLRNIGLGGALNLTGAVLSNSILTEVHFGYAELDGANFIGTNLERSNLAQCSLRNVNFTFANLYMVKFRHNRFDGATGISRDSFRGFRHGWLPHYSMLEEYPEQSEPMYRNLCFYFSGQGLFDDASWAAYRACVLRRRILRKKLSPIYLGATEGFKQLARLRVSGQIPRTPYFVLWVTNLWAFFSSFSLELVIGYGEKPFRVIGWALVIIMSFALVFYTKAGLTDNSFVGCLYFNLVTFSTLGYGDVTPKPAFRLIAATEAIFGIFICGLLLFCFGRRSVGRS